MKNLLIVAALFALAAAPSRALDLRQVPEYMMAPKSTWAPGVPTLNQPEIQTEEISGAADPQLGLRLIHLKRSSMAKIEASEALGENGVVQSGDILLSFRPSWANTLAYAHVQLGVSHAALAFLVEMNGKTVVHSLESPANYSSPLTSAHHYGDLEAFHIIRPSLSNEEKVNIKKWAKLTYDRRDRIGFFQDYGTPMFKRGVPGISKPIDQVRRLGEVVKSGGKYDAYCSEFVWSFLGLRGCSPEEFPGGTVEVFFDPLAGFAEQDPKAGLTQGPDAALRASNNAGRLPLLASQVFNDFLESPADLQGRMSSGHQAVAKANKPKMDQLKAYYAGGERPEQVASINQGIAENFSPTAFLIRCNAGLDGLKYVGTVVFDK